VQSKGQFYLQEVITQKVVKKGEVLEWGESNGNQYLGRNSLGEELNDENNKERLRR